MTVGATSAVKQAIVSEPQKDSVSVKNLPQVKSTGPSNVLRLGVAAAVTAIGAGIGALIARNGDMGWKFGAAMGALGGATVGSLGTALTWDAWRANLGEVDGQYSWQEKIGEETYNTTCTSTFNDSEGSHTHTYPCTKVRGIYRTRWSDTTDDLTPRSRIAKGSIDDVAKEIESRNKGTFVVLRTNDQYQAHKIGDGRVEWPEAYRLTTDGSVAVVTRSEGHSKIRAQSTTATAAELSALKD